MKIIDILNKIANGEEPPKKICYDDEEYIFEYDEYNFDYQNEWGVWLFEDICFDGENHLNKEVEILDNMENNKQDKKIEKLDTDNLGKRTEQYVAYNSKFKYLIQDIRNMNDKINELIDYINSTK